MATNATGTKTSKADKPATVTAPPATYIAKAATLRLQYTNDHYVAFSCFTHDLKACWLVLPASDAANPDKIISAVQNYDLYYTDISSLTFQAKVAAAARVDRKGTIAISNGWLDEGHDTFIYSDRVFRAPVKVGDGESVNKEPLVVACPDFDTGRNSNLAGFGTLPTDMAAARVPKGSVQGWKAGVATIAVQSSLMMIALSAVFAAPLLGPMDIDPFILYLAGYTSGGKSFVLLAAGSGIGLGKKKRLPTWKNTDAGLEEWVQLQYADMAFPIDELSHVGSEAKVYEKIDEAAYMFEAGVNKKKHDRTTNNQSGRPRRPTASCAIAITSYERTLAEIEDKVSHAFRPGVRVRVIEIPMRINKNAEGVFDQLPKSAGVGKQRTQYAHDLTEDIRRACAKNNGRVFIAYLKKLLADLECAKTFVRARMEWFIKNTTFDHSKGEEYRRVKHFAFLYGAGAYAIELGFLPWSRKQQLEAIRACYRASKTNVAAAALDPAAAPADSVAAPKMSLHGHLNDAKRVVPWPRRGDAANDGPGVDGWKQKEGDHTRYRIKTSAILRWYPTPKERKAVLAADKNARRSTQRVPGGDARISVFDFRIHNKAS